MIETSTSPITLRRLLHYWMVEPVRPSLIDTSESIPAWEIQIEHPYANATFAVFVDGQHLPTHARLSIPRISTQGETIPAELLPLIQAVREHFLTVLRLTFRPDAALFGASIWKFVEAEQPYSVTLNVGVEYESARFDIEAARNWFTSSFAQREELRLLLDGDEKNIPLQSRYLSLYRLLELILKPGGKWDDAGFEEALRPYVRRFKEAGFQKKPAATIHSLRNSCAHIRRSDGRLGVTHLNHEEAARVAEALPILLDFCITLVNKRADGRFRLYASPPSRAAYTKPESEVEPSA